MRRSTRHSLGGDEDADPPAESRRQSTSSRQSRETWLLYPGRDRGVCEARQQRPQRPQAQKKKTADDDGDEDNDYEEEEDEDEDEDDDDDERDASGDWEAAPAAVLMDDGRRQTRRKSVVSYKEPNLHDIRRDPSPPSNRLKRGDQIEVEVGDDGSGTTTWQSAEVVKLLGNDRFRAMVNGDAEFVEEYGPEDEGKEWRRASKYDGLKRQRKSVEHYQPGEVPRGGPSRAGEEMLLSSVVGPFRVGGGRDGGGGGERGGGRRRGGSSRRHAGSESDTLSSEEEFERRKKKSEQRLRGNVAPLNHKGDGGSSGAPAAASARPAAKASRSPAAAVLQGALDELTGARGGGGNGSGIGDAFAAAGGAKLADVQPLKVDGTVGWDQVGGLGAHVEALKEMVLIPLLYPEIFDQLGVTPPRGVLFHGPPGTGKTLVARALASTCSSAGRPVAFFMRKGADVLSKWVGEAEKQLRLLFDEATRLQPAIIFFDELDGLAPVRSSKQDYIHASIVSTLLALMDGLDSRGQVLLIGATNRIDALDSALRRPGRFDRELQFSLPSCAARREILEIHTRRWTPPLPAEQLDALARRTHGFCGADLKALCAEAALRALRGAFPEIFASEEKYLLDASRVQITREHLAEALQTVCPAASRALASPAAPLPPHLTPLLGEALVTALRRVAAVFPPAAAAAAAAAAVAEAATVCAGAADQSPAPAPAASVAPAEWSASSAAAASAAAFASAAASAGVATSDPSGRSAYRGGAVAGLTAEVNGVSYPLVHRPHLLLHGRSADGQAALLSAVLHALEGCHVYSLDLPSLVVEGSRSLSEATAHLFAEARKTAPAVVVLPALDTWLLPPMEEDPMLFATVQLCVQQLPPGLPLLLLGSCGTPLTGGKLSSLEKQRLRILFPHETLELEPPSTGLRRRALARFATDALAPPLPSALAGGPGGVDGVAARAPLVKAPPPKPREESAEERRARREAEEVELRQMRIWLREIVMRLGQDKRFRLWAAPVDPSSDEGKEFVRKVGGTPMELATLLERVNGSHVTCRSSFEAHVRRIVRCAELFFTAREEESMRIIAKAHLLLDEALEELDDLDDDLVARCEAISAARAKQGEPQADPAKPLSSAHRRTSGAHAPGGGGSSSSGTAASVAPGRRSQREAAAPAPSPDEDAAAVETAAFAPAEGATSAVEAVMESAAADNSGRVAAIDTGATSADATAAALSPEPDAHKGSGLAGGDTQTSGIADAADKVEAVPKPAPAAAAKASPLFDCARLEGFCEGVVSSTAGWSVEHLSALLCDLYAVVAKAQRPALAGGLVGADPHMALELALSERHKKDKHNRKEHKDKSKKKKDKHKSAEDKHKKKRDLSDSSSSDEEEEEESL